MAGFMELILGPLFRLGGQLYIILQDIKAEVIIDDRKGGGWIKD